ncbi:flagellar type III secretion system pore protein FliP (plasmid) [Pontibacillus sp. ALD_SL1]|uniref:flagellar type III secretion system pore protein FliP n=1 Tax=Pontibacillus sp. ALD_SL1 TaxID=2777185 RepID=UPI001A968D28|nr:flagellar type III secretion system pore protein FliP [Pontibacillus sp. ALD_SL1]QST03047.1 flagellar type III secretion system pore protein FliP [Pontibacillus sp. ALD_SL1]
MIRKAFLPLLFMCMLLPSTIHATTGIDLQMNLGSEDYSEPIKIFILMTVLAISPSILIMFTCFTHIIIVLSLTRQALGTMTLPPNPVLTGFALFLTIFIMMPVLDEIKTEAYVPYENEEITLKEAITTSEGTIKRFMVKNTYTDDLKAFIWMGNEEEPEKIEDVSIWTAIPAYTVSQISKGFFTGLMIYGAFAFIDILVGSILMFMGMFMLPPQMVSLPLKLLVFVFIGGFNKIIEVLFHSITV